jgi:hypothetical protein
MPSVPWLAVIAATVVGFALGAVWYGPLFGKAWMREVGVTQEALKKDFNPGKVYGLAFVYGLIAAYALAAFLGPHPGAGFAAGTGAMAGLAWVGTAFATNYLFERKSTRLLYINAGYHAVHLAVLGLVLGLLA